MITSIPSVVAFSLGIFSLVEAQYPAELVGTWTTKSKKVFTGPGFYDPVKDRLIEPERTGISYSFTQDGYYEEAYYRAIPNPTTPNCPSAIMQWQHGTYSLPGNGSLVLQPFGVDGRQIMSSPCSYDESVYTRYEQPELMKNYAVYTDPYHNVPRLDLYRFDGSPIQPMYLAYSPPQMLPTQTLNPTTSAAPQATGQSRVKRGAEDEMNSRLWDMLTQDESTSHNVVQKPKTDSVHLDRWWWVGVGLTAVGTVMYMLPTSI